MKSQTKNKLLAFLLVLVVAFGLAACNDNNATEADTPAGAVTTTTEGAVDTTTDTVGDAADATADSVGDAADATADTVGDAADATTDAVGDAVDTTTDTVADAADTTVDATTDVVGDAGVQINDARAQVVSNMEGLDLTNEDETNVLAVQSALTEARDNLATAYANGDEAAQTQWQELQPRFDEAEAALQDNAAEGLQQVQALLEQLQQAVSQ